MNAALEGEWKWWVTKQTYSPTELIHRKFLLYFLVPDYYIPEEIISQTISDYNKNQSLYHVSAFNKITIHIIICLNNTKCISLFEVCVCIIFWNTSKLLSVFMKGQRQNSSPPFHDSVLVKQSNPEWQLAAVSWLSWWSSRPFHDCPGEAV